MKKISAIFLTVLLLVLCTAFTAAADDEITIIINGEKLISDVPARTVQVYNTNKEYVGDRVMVPIRAISEKLNCDVYWNQETQGITLYRKNNLYIMWIGKETAFHLGGLSMSNGYKMDALPTIINDRTLVPVRAVAELLGANVNWLQESKTVDITYDLGTIEDNSALAAQCDIFQILLNNDYATHESYVNGTIKTVTGKFVLESGEEIKFELYPELAPATCEKFISLAKSQFYDNTVFHRVIEGFVAQGGGYGENYEYKTSDPISGEFIENGFLNLIPHNSGTLSFARAEDYNSGTSQFFIVHEDSPYLNGSYASFGKVTEGMEIVDKICSSETDEYDIPVTPIVVKQVIIND